jgi:hypothetical protein
MSGCKDNITYNNLLPRPTKNTKQLKPPFIFISSTSYLVKMADYKIFCKNKSGCPKAYFLFVESPEVSGGAQVYQNVYVAASTVPSGTGTATFSIHKDIFAVTGTNPGQELGSNVTVTTGDFGLAKFCQGNKLGSTFAMTGAPDGKSAFFDPGSLQQDCNKNGSFGINCAAGTFQIGNGGRCAT